MKLLSALPLLFVSTVLAVPTPQPNPIEVDNIRNTYLSKLSKRQRNPLNGILSVIVRIFPINVAIQDIDNLIGIAEQTLANILNIDTTETDLTAGNACDDVTIIFARGTTEAGNVGALVGPEFFDAVQAKLGRDASVAVQGVDYPADIPGFLAGGDKAGSQTM